MLFFRLVGGRSFFNWKLRVSYYTLAILSVLLAGISLWIYNLYVEYRNDSIYSDFMRRQLERTTQMDVRYAMQVINIADSKLEQNIKQLAVERTTTLANIMLLVGNKKIANETKSKITELFKKSIQAINSKNDVSDFFLYDSQGNPLAEAQYALNNNGLATDAMGNNRFIQIQNSLDSDFSGSFINYWPSIKLGVSENRRQLVYVQYIESLKVYIGCGIFVDQKLQELQNEILSRFEKLHFVDGNHLFVNTFNGTGVLKNGHKLTGTRSDTVPLEFLNAQLDALQNEGNHTFNYPTATDSTIVSVEAYMKWNWIVGTNIDSVHLSALEASLSNTDLTKLLLQLFLFVLIVLIMYAVVQTQQQKLYSIFTEAVNQITLNFTKFCNTNSPPPTHLFSEFDQLYQSITTEFKTVIGDLERQNTAMNFYEYVFDLYPEPILVTDTNSLIQGMNKAFTHVFGYTKADIMGNHISCFTPQEHFRENIQIQESIVASEQIAIENTHRVAKNQKLIKTTIVSKPSKNYDATEYNYLIFKTSTHTQNLTPTNDTKIPDTFKTFFDNAAIGLAVLHFDNPVDWNSGTITPENLTHVLTSLRLLHYNTQTAKLLGISKHTKSLNITDLFPNNHNFIYQRVVQLLEHKQQKFTFYLHRDKKIVWIEINLVCALDQSGFITNIYTDLRDVTEHRTLQKKLRDAKYKAELANQLKSAFLSNMSHEIRTPLTAIVGFNELLNEKDSTEEERLQYTENINQSSYVLLQLIEDIVDISKIEADMLHLDKQQVDVGDMLKKLRQTFSIYLRQANKHHIQFRFEIRDELDNISLISDRLRLEQVLSNLLHNAIKFTETGAIIVGVTISQSANLPSIRFWVRDTGIGISPKDQKIVFQRFTKLNPSLSGTGLGLSISQRLVHLLGGKLEIQSNLGIGTTFSFELPVKSKRQTDKQTEEVTKPQKVTPPTRKLKALVAEDNDLNYLLLYKILKSVGIESERAKNGMEVIHKATGEAVYDLILMDIQMPVMDGIEATSHLREQGIDIPIIAQTAFTLDRDYDRMMKAGCTIIFNKPIKAQELYAVIERTCHINLQY